MKSIVLLYIINYNYNYYLTIVILTYNDSIYYNLYPFIYLLKTLSLFYYYNIYMVILDKYKLYYIVYLRYPFFILLCICDYLLLL